MKKNNLIFLMRLTIPYILTLVLPFIALFTIYVTSINQSFELEQERNLLALQQTCDKVDSQLQSFAELSKFLAYTPDITYLLNLKKPLSNSKDFFLIYELCSRLPNYKLITPGIEDVFLFFGALDYVVQVPHAYRLSDFAKTSSIFTPTYMTEFLPTYHDNTLLTLGDDLSPELFFVSSLPYDSTANINTQLVIGLNEDLIFKELTHIDHGESGGILVLNSSNQILSSHFGENFPLFQEDLSFDQNFITTLSSNPESDYTITSLQSEYNDWTYVSIIPNELITAKVSYIKVTILTLIVATLIVTIIIVGCVALRRGLFFVNLFRRSADLTSASLSSDPYKQVEEMISSLTSHNHTLSTVIKEQNHLLKDSIIKDILYGTYDSPYQLAKTLKTTDFNLCASSYFVILIQFGSDHQSPVDTTSSIHRRIKTALVECLSFPHYDCDINTDHLALLGLQTGTQLYPPKIMDELEQLKDLLYSTHHLKTIIVLSPSCSHLLDVKKIFSQALYHCKYAIYRGLHGVLSPGELCIDTTKVFYYPLATEINLSHALHQSSQDELKALLDAIIDTNLTQHCLSLEMLEQLVFAIRRTLIQSLQPVLEDTELYTCHLATLLVNKMSVLSSLPELYHCAFDIQALLIDYHSAKQITKNQDLILRIKELIATKYADSCFNLCTLADLCSMNEHTLYGEFKNLFGVTFCDYLENYRIEVACKLLCEKNVAIKDIAGLVGYNSDYSFRRAFKRILGVAPSKYGSTVS